MKWYAMKPYKKLEAGLTLLEVILVIVIATSLTLLSVKQYQQLRLQSSISQLQANVDQIAAAAARYYYANCSGGTLDPRSTSFKGYGSQVLNITSDLYTPGYLTSYPPLNPIIAGSTAGSGYIVQLVGTSSTRTTCATPAGSTTVDCSTPIGTNVNWSIVVAVQLNDSTKAKTYLGSSGANCITNQTGTGATKPVYTCANAPSASTNYLAWEVLPSMASIKAQSVLWITNPVVKQFKQYNESYSLSYLTSVSHSPEYQYYVCGS
jgi:hypothetical protein